MINDMETTVLEKWMPTENLGKHYDVNEISLTESGLSFMLISDKRNAPKKIKSFVITWDTSDVITYNVTDETYRDDCWKLDFEKDGRFYVCRSSDLIDYFKKKSPLFPKDPIHFMIVGTNTVVDVIAKNYPETAVTD